MNPEIIPQTDADAATHGGVDPKKLNGAARPAGGRIWDELTEEQKDAWVEQILREAMAGGEASQVDQEHWQSEDEIWAATRYKAAGYGVIGIDVAIRDATAFLYRNQPGWTFEQTVEHVLGRVRAVKDRDAPYERRDWRQERREIEDKLRRYIDRLKAKDQAPTSWRRSQGAAAEARTQLQTREADMTALEFGVSIMKAGAQWTDEHKRMLLGKLNAEHAVVEMGSSVRYLHQTKTPDGQPEMRFLRAEDMKVLYEAVRVPVEQTMATAGGSTTKTKLVPAFELWRLSPERRQYDGIGFFPPPRVAPPRLLNLWTGLAIKPRNGDWSLFQDHLFNAVCSGNQEWFDWLLDYMAHAVQKPGEKPGSAVVLYSPAEGTGKTIINKMMKRIFGQHAVIIDKSEQFLGRFNAAVASKIWLATEEAFWGGDKKQLGAYKSAITEDRRLIEQKGIDPYEIDDYARVFATSNERWNTPAGVDGRRFFVLEVKNPRARDPSYFDPIWKQMLEDGGLEAMLFDLSKRDIKSNLRKPPETAALRDQRQRTLDGVQQWLVAVATDGEIRVPGGDVIVLNELKPTTILRGQLIAAAMAELRQVRPGDVRTELGQLLPRVGFTKGREGGGQRRLTYTAPSLHGLQDAVEREFKIEIAS
jgi:hypothetical protein